MSVQNEFVPNTKKKGKKSSSATKVFQSYWSWSFSEESGKSVVLHLVYLKRQFGCVRGDNHPVARIISFCSPICFWWCRISFVSLSPSLTRLHTGTLTFSVCEDEFTVLCMSCLLKWILWDLYHLYACHSQDTHTHKPHSLVVFFCLYFPFVLLLYPFLAIHHLFPLIFLLVCWYK